MKFSVVEVRPDEAERFWQASSTASVYLHPRVAEALTHECRWFLLMVDGSPCLMWPIAFDSNGSVVTPVFSYYFGPVWADQVEKSAVSTRHRIHADGLNTIIDYLLGLFPALRFELPLQFNDVRPFTWWNYDGPVENRFQVEPRYTAQITELATKSDEAILGGFRRVRQREVRQVKARGNLELVYEVPWRDAALFCQSLMKDRGHAIDPGESAVAGLGKLVQGGWGLVLGARHRGEEELGAVLVVLRAKNVAHFVFGGARQGFREKGVWAWHTFQAIKLMKDLGDHAIDFNGANSPNRGDDKHSYGAVEKLYFRLSYGNLDFVD